ncbi:MAG: RDD family protein [Chloroflexi bacterium]|nr:RDD family protein [Chloroflexota bacterium]
MNEASLGARLIALIIDSIILSIIGALLGGLTGEEILGIGSGFIFGVIYNWYFWTQNRGQTPGKMVMGIRVVKTDGSSLNSLEAVVRYIGYYINTFLLMLGWIWAIFDGKKQGLHDKLAGTVVVRA